MCISLFFYGRPVVVRCKGVRLGMGWVGSVIWWVGLGWVDENRPTDNSGSNWIVRIGQWRIPKYKHLHAGILTSPNMSFRYNKCFMRHSSEWCGWWRSAAVKASASTLFADNHEDLRSMFQWWRSLLHGLPLDERSVSTFALAMLQQ